MKYIMMLLALVVVVVKGEETYATDHDYLDVEAVVADKDQFKSFIGCFICTAPCDEVAAAFKMKLPEAIVQACAKCTAAQKNIAKVFNRVFKKNLPKEYEKFKHKFDPENKYFANFEAAISAF